MPEYTDTELLDFLQSLNDKSEYTGLCVLRDSISGRGWRLHETSQHADKMNNGQTPVHTVRDAIANFMNQQ